jgi:hypothetical protein
MKINNRKERNFGKYKMNGELRISIWICEIPGSHSGE